MRNAELLTDFSMSIEITGILRELLSHAGVRKLAPILQSTAFNDREVTDLLNQGTREIYLCGSWFDIESLPGAISFVGLNGPILRFVDGVLPANVRLTNIGLIIVDPWEARGFADHPDLVRELMAAASIDKNPEAQLQLGICYENGWGFDRDIAKAIHWYQAAAEQGNAAAQYELAEHLYYGNGIPENRDEAKWLFQAAAQTFRILAEAGNAEAQNRLGIAYYWGHGVRRNKKSAVKWQKLAAAQGHAWAQFNLAECYRDGIGVQQNLRKAFQWFGAAAEQGNIAAQYELGRCYQTGQGTEKDLFHAAQWYRKAAAQGHEEARHALEQPLPTDIVIPSETPDQHMQPGEIQPSQITWQSVRNVREILKQLRDDDSQDVREAVKVFDAMQTASPAGNKSAANEMQPSEQSKSADEADQEAYFAKLFAKEFPNDIERLAILELYLKKRGIWNQALELTPVVNATLGYSGIGLGTLLEDAVGHVIANGRSRITTADLLRAKKRIEQRAHRRSSENSGSAGSSNVSGTITNLPIVWSGALSALGRLLGSGSSFPEFLGSMLLGSGSAVSAFESNLGSFGVSFATSGMSYGSGSWAFSGLGSGWWTTSGSWTSSSLGSGSWHGGDVRSITPGGYGINLIAQQMHPAPKKRVDTVTPAATLAVPVTVAPASIAAIDIPLPLSFFRKHPAGRSFRSTRMS